MAPRCRAPSLTAPPMACTGSSSAWTHGPMIVAHIAVFMLGALLIVTAVVSAVRTFVVPRGTPSRLTRIVFVVMRYVFGLASHWARPAGREQAMAYFAPVTLLTLPIIWLAIMLLGYTAVFWALGASTWSNAFTISRLSLLYLGADIQ